MKALSIDPAGIEIMRQKGQYLILKTDPITFPAANILKQQILSVGGECAVSRDVATGKAPATPVILIGNRRQYKRLIESIKNQYFGLGELAVELEKYLAKICEPKTFRIGSHSCRTDGKTLVMGILNVTPDSFYDGGKNFEVATAVEAACQMEAHGADIIDIGGESTRPGSDPISTRDEIARLQPIIEQLISRIKIPLSVDTYKSAVAEWALQNGAVLINDISGLNFDPTLAETIAKHKAGVVLMHIKGTPKNMQVDPHYDNLIDEILAYLTDSIEKARLAGINEAQIFIDPGIGFGKTVDDNYRILHYLEEFQSLGYPILIGPSRKSFIGKVLDLSPSERLEGTLAAVTAAVLNGASIIRVHDVQAVNRAVKIADAIRGIT